jgi:hypothetical protein
MLEADEGGMPHGGVTKNTLRLMQGADEKDENWPIAMREFFVRL